MGRPKVPQRKKQLLDEILIYLQDKPLSSISFRTMADALGVSTYVLVYQFGTREQLLADIVREVNFRANSAEMPERIVGDWPVVKEFMRQFLLFNLAREEAGFLLRLEFEAALLETTGSLGIQESQQIITLWLESLTAYFTELGISQKQAELNAEALADTVTGMFYNNLVSPGSGQIEERIDFFCELMETLIAGQLGKLGIDAEKAFATQVDIPLGVISYLSDQRP